jgi:ankyrin repeat protein
MIITRKQISIQVDIEARDSLGRQVLHVAANACDDTRVMLMFLCRGADPLAETNSKDRPSDFAKLQGHGKAKLLLKQSEMSLNSVNDEHIPHMPEFSVSFNYLYSLYFYNI